MSMFSKTHDVIRFKPGTDAADGMRLVRIIGKTKKDKKSGEKIAGQSYCVNVRPITEYVSPAQLQDARLIPHINAMLESAQDAIVRGFVAKGKLAVSDSDISFESCLMALAAENAGKRKTKESLEAWFDGIMRENILLEIADKLNLPDSFDDSHPKAKLVNQTLENYREAFASCAARKVRLGDKMIASLTRLVKEYREDALEDSESVESYLMERMNAMNADDDALML